MGIKTTISTFFLAGAIGLTGCFFAENTDKNYAKPIIQEKVIYVAEEECPAYGKTGNDISELLEHSLEIINKNPNYYPDYIIKISKIGIENGYGKEIINMMNDETIEERINEMPYERKIKIIEPLIKDELKNKYSKILDFLDKQKPRVDSFYKNLEKKINNYLDKGGNSNESY
ncbi:MAG: hypothetical protein PHV16_00055 [Candidatus Nanoarchaeia archaeon]|nr:hypothetical protein [Candidatus Nanoarchaeia archaeon]